MNPPICPECNIRECKKTENKYGAIARFGKFRVTCGSIVCLNTRANKFKLIRKEKKNEN